MKFDFAIGNPPYQEENENNGRQSPVYNYFMDEAYQIANCVEMIHPARFLFDAGQTPKAWNKKMLEDEHFKVLEYESNAAKVFPSTEIKGGVAITLRDSRRTFEALKVFTKHPELDKLYQTVFSKYDGPCIDSIVSSRGTYRVTDLFFKTFPYAVTKLGKGTGNMIASNFFECLPEVWKEKPFDGSIGILARVNNQRRYCWIKREYIRDNDFIAGYNVSSPKSNGNGIFGEVLTQTEIIPANCGATDTFINIGSFKTQEEAEALTKYIKTKFFRALLGIKKVTQDNSKNVWSMIPLQDFTHSSDIHWNLSINGIDIELYQKYNLTQEEIDFIETNVKEMA